MTEFADSIRAGDFSRRVEIASQDELSRLAAAFNQMAQALAEMRRIDLGQLLRAKSSLEATLAAVPDAVLLVDPRERVASMNQTARTIFGRPIPDDACLDDLPLPAAAVCVVREALRGETPPRPGADLAAAFDHTAHDETRRLLPVAAPVPHFEGDAYGAVLILYDVTDFAKLDELRMELIAVASHELRTPLTTVKMNLLLMNEDAADFPQRRRLLLDSAVAGAEELGKTIDELLDLTRVDAGQLRLTLDRLDVSFLVDQACGRLAPRFEEAGISLRVVKDVAHADAVCNGDAARLGMVLANLLANALKYTPSGGSVTVHVSSVQNAGTTRHPTLQIAVTDNGRGIPAEFQERVFDKFFRVEHHQKTDGKEPRGTGIGLYLCKHIIQAHGGNIRCDAGDGGVGTRVAFTLPREV
jgi:NtrC-family two-component system sensor histidine kinase KinB